MSTKPLVLVTGAASGRQGSTGHRIVTSLLQSGFPVRAMVRTYDDRAKLLHQLGAEVVISMLANMTRYNGAAFALMF